jgi:hypothetical protein
MHIPVLFIFMNEFVNENIISSWFFRDQIATVFQQKIALLEVSQTEHASPYKSFNTRNIVTTTLTCSG